MDKKYIDEHTKDWFLKDEEKGLKLYIYFDMVEWCDMWAIVDTNGRILYHWSAGGYSGYDLLSIVAEVVSKTRP
jgi:hypothetical protein